MALYQGTALVSRIIGKLGTNDFMRWRNKNVVRTSPPVVTDPHSTAQARMRDALGASAVAWYSTLTQPQRNAWETFARLQKYLQKNPSGIRRLPQGNGGIYAGMNAFILCNQLIASFNGTPITDPPTNLPAPPPPSDFDVTWDNVNTKFVATWTKPAGLDDLDPVRIWIDSVQETFHKQIALAVPVAQETTDISEVAGALGAVVDLTTLVGEAVLIQADIVTLTGLKSKPTKTFELIMTP